jgi:3-dehydroquinate synthase
LIRNLKSAKRSIIYNQSFSVPYQYQVCFTSRLFDLDNSALLDALCRSEPQKRHRVVIFIDEGVTSINPQLIDQIKKYAGYHDTCIDLVTDPIQIAGGEKIKVNLQCVQSMQKVLFDHHMDRHSFVIGIGGGALLDAVGWVAATTHRGVRHIRVPTTVLGQNDSGVGVKNGVNFFGVKNYMGAFAPPWAVINDIEFVMTLPHRDKIAGMAEAVKVALIRDQAFFLWLEQNADALVRSDRGAMEYMIRRCAELHMKQIACGGDPFEMGSARPLDYGHWSAHKIESMTEYEIRHGEAVAIGLALDARYSALVGLLEPHADQRVCQLLEKLGFKLWHDALGELNPDGSRVVMQGLIDFKEHLGGELTITLLQSIGVGIEVHEMDNQKVISAIDWLKHRNATRKN